MRISKPNGGGEEVHRYTRAEILAAFPPVERPKKESKSQQRTWSNDDRAELELARDALRHINADDREVWLQCGMALKERFGDAGRPLWDNWSAGSSKYEERDQDKTWRLIGRRDGITIATLFHYAQQAGWTGNGRQHFNGSEQRQSARSAKEETGEKITPIRWLDMSNWDNEPRPERDWTILNRVPAKQSGLFSGEGGTGKSIIEMMKDVAHVTGKDWLGSLPEPGPAFYIGAEDDEKEIHIRFYDIAAHYGVTFKDLVDGGLKILCLLGQDATLCATGKSGKVETTALYHQLYEAAGDIKPKNISIDTLSRAFAGSEIDRVQVHAFNMHMQALAIATGGSVTILSHPSLQGIASGSGISGSTAWHGAFRFRQYLKSAPKNGNDEQADDGLRQLEFKKNQYGPTGETIVLCYQRGLFLPVTKMGTLDKLAAEQAADHLFLELLDKFQAQGRNVSHLKTANSYAPTMFAKDPKAKAPGIHKTLADAMERLFAAKKIKAEEYGPRSRLHHRIARCDPQQEENAV